MGEFDTSSPEQPDSNINQGAKSGIFRRAGTPEPTVKQQGATEEERTQGMKADFLEKEHAIKTEQNVKKIQQFLDGHNWRAKDAIGNLKAVEMIAQKTGLTFSLVESGLRTLDAREEEKRRNYGRRAS